MVVSKCSSKNLGIRGNYCCKTAGCHSPQGQILEAKQFVPLIDRAGTSIYPLMITFCVTGIKRILVMRTLFSYGAVGVVGSAIYIFCTVYFIETIGISPVISSGLSFIVSFVFSLFANHYFVFRSKENISKTVVRYALVSALGFSLTTLIMYVTVEISKRPYLYGVAVVLFVIPLSNYLLNLHWTFKKSRSR